FPLAAAPQVVMDGPGVAVDLGGAELMHRTAVGYPADALRNRVEGTVMLQVTVDSAGNVTDASVLSGPQELRKTAIQAVLQWHFMKGGSNMKMVSIAFQLPQRTVEQELAPPAATPGGTVSTGAAPAPPPLVLRQSLSVVAPAPAAGAGQAPGWQDSSEADRAREMAILTQNYRAAQANSVIRGITVAGLSDTARAQLLASLPVHVEDAATVENLARLRDAVRQFDEHLTVTQVGVSDGNGVEIRIQAPGAGAPALAGGDFGRGTQVAANEMSARLIKRVVPVYPALARSTRVEGAVVLAAVIGKDGSVTELKAVSGHPLLVPAALSAVRQWMYQPMMVGGAPVEVSTEITVSFSLQSAGPAGQ
ncbi:MAG TPA: energy transducer TonB, partial [Bryobacteraceae bacterium]|nr:energy transducer TonB [Bryobacteraceae bacterium]